MPPFISDSGTMRALLKWIADKATPHVHNYRSWERKNRWLRRAGLNIGSRGVAIDSNFSCLTGLEENIHIEDYTAIGINCSIWNYSAVRIGRFCMIASESTLVNGGHDTNTFEPFSGPLLIGSGCWIGNGARIVGPLVIGENSIVAAGAVVIHDVAPGTIVAGVPARKIGDRALPSKVWHLGDVYFDPLTFEVVEE
jgi:acetyltransferase-like isoleucine patch superfamily enzyme